MGIKNSSKSHSHSSLGTRLTTAMSPSRAAGVMLHASCKKKERGMRCIFYQITSIIHRPFLPQVLFFGTLKAAGGKSQGIWPGSQAMNCQDKLLFWLRAKEQWRHSIPCCRWSLLTMAPLLPHTRQSSCWSMDQLSCPLTSAGKHQ